MSGRFVIRMQWKMNAYYMTTSGAFSHESLMYVAGKRKIFNSKAEAELVLREPQFQKHEDQYTIEELR